MAIKYPIRKRVYKGPKIVNRGSGIQPQKHPKAHPTSTVGASGMTTPKAMKTGGHRAHLRMTAAQQERL